MRRLLAIAIVVALSLGALPVTAAGPCEFKLGFKALGDQISETVGQCVENERWNTSNGDSLQQTTKGLMVWRKSDNFTAFTDGYRSWVNGPNGLQQRLNTENFEWEVTTPIRAQNTPQPTPTPVTLPILPTPRPAIIASGIELSEINVGWGNESKGRWLPYVSFTVTNRTSSVIEFGTEKLDNLFFAGTFRQGTYQQGGSLGFPMNVLGAGMPPGFTGQIISWGAYGYGTEIPRSNLPAFEVEVFQGNPAMGQRRSVGKFQGR